MKITRLCFDLDATNLERLPQIVAAYDLVMNQPVPDTFDDMLAWAYARQGAQAELARFFRKIYDVGGIVAAEAGQ